MFEAFLNAGKKYSPIIIAEIGAKYAELSVMHKMIAAAKECGADMVKFQTYKAETISTPGALFTMEDGSKVEQYEFFKRYELSLNDHQQLIDYCKQRSVGWLSTPSHVGDVDLLEQFNPVCYKTGSDDVTNLPLLQYIARKGKPMLISTGMCTLGEIEKAAEAVASTGNKQIVLLHCVVSYPSRHEDANLRVIETLRRSFGFPVGLSDHSQDEFTSILATQLGVAVIEKHFTLDHALKLPDHQASLDAMQFKRLVQAVRMVPKALGDGVKNILETEKKWRRASRKSLFSSREIKQGAIISEEDVAIRRPSDGIHPHCLELIIGREARCTIPKNTLLSWGMF